MKFDRNRVQDYLKNFDFASLFIEKLLWDNVNISPLLIEIEESVYELNAVAQKRGMIVYHCQSKNNQLPPQKIRRKIDTEVTAYTREHLIIYSDSNQQKQVWQWVKREGGKATKNRETTFNIAQSGELLIQKLETLMFSWEEEDKLTLPEVTQRTEKAFDIEKVTKEFFSKFQEKHLQLVAFIEGIDDSKDASWYASVILNRLIFIYFLQKKGFLDNQNTDYLQDKLKQSQAKGKDLYYQEFLQGLFFEGFGKREELRSERINSLIGKIKYLNGGLFLPHSIEI